MTAKAYLLKIRGGVEVDSKGQKAGKGPLIAEEISNTLGTSQDQYLFQPVDKFVLDDQGGSVIRWRWDGKSPCLRAQMGGHTPVVLENHPSDSRVRIDESGIVQTLTSSMGTGGGNVPMVMMPFSKSRRAKSTTDFETWKSSEVSNTINTFDQGDVRATDVVVMANTLAQRDYKQPQTVVYPKKTVGSLMASAYNKLGTQEAMNDMFVVCEKGVPKTISMEVFHCNSAEERTAALKARDYKDPQIIALDRAALNQGENAKYDFSITGGGTAQTLIARGPGAVCYRKPVRK